MQPESVQAPAALGEGQSNSRNWVRSSGPTSTESGQSQQGLLLQVSCPPKDRLVIQSSRCNIKCLRAGTGADAVRAHLKYAACSLSGAKAVQGAWGA